VANPVWPTTLPQGPYQQDDGPDIQPQSNAIRTPMDVGPAKQRRRFTAVPSPITFNLLLSETEIAILDTFVQVTLLDVMPFDWIDFQTGATATYRFMARPTKKHYGDVVWTVGFQLEKLP
jgi:hypothetical protein